MLVATKMMASHPPSFFTKYFVIVRGLIVTKTSFTHRNVKLFDDEAVLNVETKRLQNVSVVLRPGLYQAELEEHEYDS